jgi:hypothetical protein
MKNQTSKQPPWTLIFIIVLAVLIYSNGGKERLRDFLMPGPKQEASTNQENYEVPTADPTKNSPGADYFNDFIKNEVPTESRWKVSVADLFDLDLVKLNQYFSESVYKEADTKIEVATYARPRAAGRYTAIVWPTNFITKLAGVDGEVLDGSVTSTITSADVFLTVGTTQGAALAGISKIEVVDNTINITSNIKITALLAGIPISEEDNNPQVEHSTVSTPNPKLEGWLGFSENMPTESTLNNLGLSQVSKEALWLLLHVDGNGLWADFKTSIETPGEGHANDILVPYIKSAFCSKLAEYQKQLEESGTILDEVECEQLTFNITLVAVPPTNSTTGDTDMAYLTMSRTGAYVQIPDPNYSVTP